jgi:HWE histidine kinase
MFEIDDHLAKRHSNAVAPPPEFLAAENVSLRLLLAQAEIDAQKLLAQAGIDAKEREAADKLQKLILEELHHRIKNTLATVGAIASQSLRHVPGAEHRAARYRRPAARAGAGSQPSFTGKMDQCGSRQDRSRRHRSFRQSRRSEVHDCGA